MAGNAACAFDLSTRVPWIPRHSIHWAIRMARQHTRARAYRFYHLACLGKAVQHGPVNRPAATVNSIPYGETPPSAMA